MKKLKIMAMDEQAKAAKYPPSSKQWQAISLTGTDILVAAAAGSGKTEVLSERISRKIVNDDWNINEVLVLTFTKAASKEMLERIEKKMTTKLIDINSEWSQMKLKNQRLLMAEAQVTTIDAFCANVLKKFYYLVEEVIDGKVRYLSPNFRILEDRRKYLNRAVEELLSELYIKDKKSLDLLFEIFLNKQNIVDVIKAIYEKMLTIPNYQTYIKEKLFSNISTKNYSNILKDMKDLSINNYKEIAIKISDELNKIANFREKKRVDFNLSESRRDFLEKVDSEIIFDDTLENKEVLKNLITDILAENYSYTSEDLLVIFGKELEDTSKSRKKIKAKTEMEVLLEENIEYSKLIMIKEYFEFKTRQYKFVEIFKNVLLDVDNKFLLAKRNDSFLDFTDLSHLAIKALEKVEDGKRKDTEASLYYKKLFKEIYVDEYQDNNDLQEYILGLVKSDSSSYFRVGDVKQSIYGFRGSNPDLFEEKYQSYSNIVDFISDEKYDIDKDYEFEDSSGKDGIYIILKENYRSYENVLKTSNFVFNRLMGYGAAGVSYDKDSALYYPESKRKNQDKEEFIASKLISLESTEVKALAAENLAEKISLEIKRLQEKGIRYSDCALLLRTSKEMKIYSDVLSKYGIPSYYREKEGLTNSYAFNMLFNLLNFLDNKTREASLLVILKTILNVSYADLYELSKVEGRHLYDKLKTTDLKAFIGVKEKIEYWIKFAEDATAYDVVKEVVQSEYLYEYFAGRDLENSEMDYYENVLTILKKTSQEDFNLAYSVAELREIAKEKIYESARRSPENSVIISTIHNSKGLEYDYVFLTGLDGDFRFDDRDKLLFTTELALAYDESMFYRHEYAFGRNRNYILNSKLIRKKSIEEEIRNLYVALTRAKKALYICTTKKFELVDSDEPNSEKSLASLLQKAFRKYEKLDVEDITESGVSIVELEESQEDEIAKEKRDKVKSDKYDFKIEENFVEKQLQYLGPKYIEKESYPIKTSYSHMKRYNEIHIMENNQDDEDRIQEFEKYSKVKSKKGVEEAILLGNTIHKLFERIVKSISSGEKIEDTDEFLSNIKRVNSNLQNIKEKRILTEEEYRLINNDKSIDLITSFINSEVIDLVKNSKKIDTELAFTSMKKASEIYSGVSKEASNDKIILQGVIDLLLNLDDKTFVIIDYKTDRVTKKDGEKILKERHKAQLEIYADAVYKYYGEDIVVKKYIYSYVLARLIEIQ